MQPVNDYKKKARSKIIELRDDDRGVSVNRENFMGRSVLTYRKRSGVRPAQLIHRPIDT